VLLLLTKPKQLKHYDMKVKSISGILICTMLFGAAFSIKPKQSKIIEKQFKFIPSGKVLVEEDTLTVQAFKMLDHEVTNLEYREFLDEMKTERPDIYSKLEVNEKGWSEHYNQAYLDPMVEHYFKHPAYNNYPVVNITQFAAKEYCKWLGIKLNKDREQKLVVRLPKRAEFIRAGAGDRIGVQFSWGNNNMQNVKGDWLCNFTRIPQSRMSKEGDDIKLKGKYFTSHLTKKEAMLTAETKSYFPSQFEIYNLNGNVAEWIDAENKAAGGSWHDYGYDVRLQSVKIEKESSPEIGFRPVFTYVEKE